MCIRDRDKPELFGHPKASVFPLLTKILDANDWLSVQVHPDDAYGMEHEGELGKTECWYTVSYTHLDVYKRQGRCLRPSKQKRYG